MGKKPETFKSIGNNFDEIMETLLIKNTKKIDKKAFMRELFDNFELIRNEHEEIEFWFARDLQELLGYKKN